MKKILLATDGSSYAEEAAWFLAHLPHDEKLELIVLSVLHVPHTQRSSLARDWIDRCLEQAHEQAEETYDKICQMFEGANIAIRHAIRNGHPGEAIVQFANEQSPNLTVVGARGHSVVGRLLLGSTSDYVATHAPSSVLVVRPTGIRQQKRPIRIAIGYEATGPAQAALEEISEFKWGQQPDVRVISVSYIAGFYDDELRKVATKAVEQAAEQIRDVAPNVQAHLLEHDHIGEGLVTYTEQHDCDILVVGESPRTRLGRVLMGSMTRFVLRHAPCSVWITRNRIIKGIEKEKVESEMTST